MRLTGYHASYKVFDKPTEFKSMRGIDFGPGFYFATDIEDTRPYGSAIFKAEVILEHPLEIKLVGTDEVALDAIQKALRVDRETMEIALSDGTQPFAALMGLAKALVSAGALSPKKLLQFFKKLGFDGVYVYNEVLEKAVGDYFTVLDPEQILTWERVRRV